MRVNPRYYRAYIYLRPDHAWRRIIYPYYYKYVVLNDIIFFRYIDIDIKAFIRDSTSGNII